MVYPIRHTPDTEHPMGGSMEIAGGAADGVLLHAFAALGDSNMVCVYSYMVARAPEWMVLSLSA
jgi:hypothetical protein